MTNESEDQLSARDVVSATALAALWFAVVRPGGLDLAYFWDEADVYVPGARWVAEHGLNVTPGVFPDDYSRGHPPLLYLLAGAAFAAFGPEPTVGHLLILPLAVAALVGTYLLGASLYDRRVGAASALLLAATPLFMTMGNMLLPEMPLTALAVLSFLALARGRLGVAALLGVAAVLIKETGIFAAAAVGVVVLYDARERGVLRSAQTAKRAALAALPLLALAAFLGWQRVTAGYFIFPHHQGLFVDRPFALENLVTVAPSLLAWHGRWLVVGGATLASFALRARPAPGGAGQPPASRWVPSRASVLVGFAALIALNWLFFIKMFWLERYALPAHPGLLIVATGALFASRGRGLWLARGAVVAATALGLAALYGPAEANAEEHTFAYADVIATHRAAFGEIEGAETDGPGALVVTSWPMDVELRHPYLGYVDAPVRSRDLRYLTDEEDGQVTHVLLDTASSQAGALREEAERRGLEPVGHYQLDGAPRLELYGPPSPRRRQ